MAILRFTKGKWFVDASVERKRLRITVCPESVGDEGVKGYLTAVRTMRKLEEIARENKEGRLGEMIVEKFVGGVQVREMGEDEVRVHARSGEVI